MSDQREPFGLTLFIDKPLEWTSFDVVNKMKHVARHATGQKKFKVGHAGTLDPLASGLVIVCLGKHTKRIQDFMDLPKQYTGTLQLGATTPSYDLETEIDHRFDLPPADEKGLKEATKQFTGEIKQYPPAFSAKRIDGKRAYELARKGEEVEMKPSMVTVERFEIETSSFPEINFLLDCSKGTYVRSLAHDYGKALKSGAHLTALRRTAIGPHRVENAMTPDQAAQHFKQAYVAFEKGG